MASNQKTKTSKSKAEQPAIWTPQRGPQHAFHAAPDSVFELCYGGAAGGGKSDSLLVEALRFAHIKDYRAIIFRRTYPEIEKSLVPRAYELLYDKATPKNKGMEWKFHSGATLYLSHLQREEDKEKHKSAEYDYIGFDELTSFTESQYIYLFSRCRGKNPDIVRKIRGATNPTGIGHSWVKKRFVEIDPSDAKLYSKVEYEYAFGWLYDGKVYTDFTNLPKGFEKGSPAFTQEEYGVYKDNKTGLKRAFIPALMWGNERLIKSDPSYMPRLGALPKKQQDALLYGKWDAFEGQFFSEWDPDVHVVEAFDIPKHWRKFVAIDYGYAAPFCALWFAIDEDGVVYVYRELYATKMTTEDQARAIMDLSTDEDIEWFACDPSMFARQGTGESHAGAYSRATDQFIGLIGASNKRVPGWALVHEYLAGKKLKIFPQCANLIRTLPVQIHSRTNPEDLDTTQEDHAVDALRYFLTTLKGWSSPKEVEASTSTEEDLWHARMKQKKAKKRSFIKQITL